MAVVTAAPSTGLGTYIELAVTSAKALPEAEALLRRTIDELDVACSRFRQDSELCNVNAAAGRPVAASALFRAAVRAALNAAAETQGLVDPTVGGDLEAVGYDRDFRQLPPVVGMRAWPAGWSTWQPRTRLARWQEVEVDDNLCTVMVPRGCTLDLGATAKALGADLAATTLAQRLNVGVLVSLGGDVSTSGSAPEEGWAVRTGVTNGTDEAETVLLADGAMATSSPEVRQWRHRQNAMHHILDPRTGQPAPIVWRGVTVAAPTCLEANTLTTAAVVLGEAAPVFLDEAQRPARLVAADGRIIRLAGWPQPTEWSR